MLPCPQSRMKCQLVALDRTSYDVSFSDADWARMQEAFPSGVCDYSLESVSAQDAQTWMAYDVVGGEPLGPRPVSSSIPKAVKR